MSYAHDSQQHGGSLRDEAGKMPARSGAGPVTYLSFALSVGFAAALVLGILA